MTTETYLTATQTQALAGVLTSSGTVLNSYASLKANSVTMIPKLEAVAAELKNLCEKFCACRSNETTTTTLSTTTSSTSTTSTSTTTTSTTTSTTLTTTPTTTFTTSTTTSTSTTLNSVPDLVEPSVYGLLNTTACKSLTSIMGANYVIKNACYLQAGGTQADCRKLCRSIGMELFAIQSEAQLMAIQNITATYHPITSGSGGTLRIDGTYFNSTSWIVYPPRKTILNPPLYPAQYLASAGNCLSIKVVGTVYLISQLSCDEKSWTFCEFYPNTTTTMAPTTTTQAPTCGELNRFLSLEVYKLFIFQEQLSHSLQTIQQTLQHPDFFLETLVINRLSIQELEVILLDAGSPES